MDRSSSQVGNRKADVTLLDIAALAGVSRATVSLVMRENPAVAVTTRDRVLEAAKSLGYVYNRAASSLRTSHSSSVGILVTTVGNPFFAEVIEGVESVLSNSDRLVILGQHSESLDMQDRLLNRLLEYRVEGVILTAASGTSAETIHRLTEMGVAVVLCTRRIEGTKASYVGSDNEAGARRAVQHLTRDHEIRSFAFIGGRASGSPHIERSRGMKKALKGTTLAKEAIFTLPTAPTREEAYHATAELLSLSPPLPLGVFAYNDVVAFGVAASVRDAGLVVGRDVLLVGFDDVQASHFEQPPLTTVSIGATGLGALAAKTLVDLIVSKGDPVDVVQANSLVVRGSCGCENAETRFERTDRLDDVVA